MEEEDKEAADVMEGAFAIPEIVYDELVFKEMCEELVFKEVGKESWQSQCDGIVGEGDLHIDIHNLVVFYRELCCAEITCLAKTIVGCCP